jgi:hypothetical protein
MAAGTNRGQMTIAPPKVARSIRTWEGRGSTGQWPPGVSSGRVSLWCSMSGLPEYGSVSLGSRGFGG